MASAVELKIIPGRGRGLITTRHVDAGEIVLAEEPLLLTVSQEFKDLVCTNCLCWLERCTDAVRCGECHQAAFCSPVCQQQAASRPWVHAAATCRAYAAVPQLFPDDTEQQNYLRFLIQAAAVKAAAAAAVGGGGSSDTSLAHKCAAAYQVLLGLVGEPTPSTTAAAAVLHQALCTAIGDAAGQLLSAAEVASLLAKEQLNCFGLLAPLHLQQQPQHSPTAAAVEEEEEEEEDGGMTSRRLRGAAIYPVCSLLNHECLPNVARFDALDAAVGGPWPAQWPDKQQQQHLPAAPVAAVAGSDAAAAAALAAAAGLSAGPNGSGSSSSSTTLVTLRALHALPAGSEVVLSYTPLNWDLQERQQQTQQVYGFHCSCPRCLLESSPEWRAEQEGGGDGDSSSRDWETDSGSDVDLDTSPTAAAAAAAGEAAAAGGAAAAEGMEEDATNPPQQQQQHQGEALEPAYLSLFLLKYMCPKEGCFGTMAAVQGSSSGVCECSVCGATRGEAEFMAELEQQQ